MRNNYLYIFLFVFLVGAFSSCDNDYGIEILDEKGTKSEAFAGDWYVTYQVKGAAESGHYEINTFNTSENEKNVFWIKEDFQVKVNGESDLSFSAQDGVDITAADNLISLTGNIYKGIGISKTGNATDSIYMEVVYARAPTVTYTIKGHKNTRWGEDDY